MTDRTTMLSSNSHTRFGRSGLAKAALILIAILVASPVATLRAATTAPLFTMTSISSGVGDVNSYSIGYIFTTSNPLIISAMGVLDHNGSAIATVTSNGGDVPISLFKTSDHSTVLTGAVSSADPILSLSGGTYTSGDGFRYRDLASPFTLSAGQYELVYWDNAGKPIYGFNAVNLQGVTFNGGMYSLGATSATYASSAAAFPNSYFGPNLLVLPEPASATLLLLLLPALARRNRRAGRAIA